MSSSGLSPSSVTTPPARCTALPLSDLDQAILLTVLYADLFDYPLTQEEAYQRLIRLTTDRVLFSEALSTLTGTYLTATAEGYITWLGRERLVAVRRRRERIAQDLWTQARRYAQWMARVPFMRMVAVSGSLAVQNAEARSDIDLFCITAPNRLWLARTCIVPLSKLTRLLPRRFPSYLCPNYILALNDLDVDNRNLFTAHEITQAVPLWGGAVYRRFLHENTWVRTFLPDTRFERPAHTLQEPTPPWYTRWVEQTLRGSLGDAFDRLAYRIFTAFYRRRAERAGWSWARLAPAYQRSRYTVPEGGYARVIHRLFSERVRERLGTQHTAHDLEDLFSFPQDASDRPVYDWEERFAEDYGQTP